MTRYGIYATGTRLVKKRYIILAAVDYACSNPDQLYEQKHSLIMKITIFMHI